MPLFGQLGGEPKAVGHGSAAGALDWSPAGGYGQDAVRDLPPFAPSAGELFLEGVRASMTRRVAVVFCLCSIPVLAMTLLQGSAANPLPAAAATLVFAATLLVVGRHPRLAGAFVSLVPFGAVAIGSYLDAGSGVATLHPAYAMCVVIASACWSYFGSFLFAIVGGAMATYGAHTHMDLTPEAANVAGAKVTVLLFMIAAILRGVLGSLARAFSRELAQEQRMRSLIWESSEGMLVCDEEDRIQLANPEAARMIGREPATLANVRLDSLNWLDEPSLARLEAAARDGATRTTGCELRAARDGQIFEASLSPLTRGQGDWTRLLVLRDITAQRAEEAAQAEMQRRVQESNSLESLGRLAGGIAHDFNNLLTVILSTVELVTMRKGLPPDLAKELGTMGGAAQRAADLTSQLLAVARKQVLRPKVFCPNKVVRDILPLLQRLVPESISLHVHCADDLANVQTDPAQLERVVVNLVTNAVEAMPAGGQLTIETANVVIDRAYTGGRRDVEPGEYVQLSVSDTGVGMSEETLSRVFEPFFTTKGKERGTGLGLATTHGIIRQSGGHVHVYSEPDEGTTFRVYLPRVTDTGTDTADLTPVAQACRPLRVLLVEDQEAVRASVRRMLTQLGHQVDDAHSGETALAEHSAAVTQYDLLMTDVVMPGINGPQLAAGLRSANPNLRVLYMSGYTENTIVRHGALAPDVEYLAKPFDLRTLGAAIARAMATTEGD